MQLLCRMTIAIRAGTAIIIASGIALGPEAGFLIGALSRFVLNFYEGQGPWTPWQMFCWGLLGFLAGLAFNRATVEKLKSRDFKVVMGPLLCVVFAVLTAYLLYLLFPPAVSYTHLIRSVLLLVLSLTVLLIPALAADWPQFLGCLLYTSV